MFVFDRPHKIFFFFILVKPLLQISVVSGGSVINSATKSSLVRAIAKDKTVLKPFVLNFKIGGVQVEKVFPKNHIMSAEGDSS